MDENLSQDHHFIEPHKIQHGSRYSSWVELKLTVVLRKQDLAGEVR